ncbi:MAG: hypothetical protein GY796_35925, partial [Chloroflexi bacterium]|nr:hypothetical protein [Chloroflexota bacterium]
MNHPLISPKTVTIRAKTCKAWATIGIVGEVIVGHVLGGKWPQPCYTYLIVRKRIGLFLLALGMSLLAWGTPAQAQVNAPAPTPTPAPTATPAPTHTPQPTEPPAILIIQPTPVPEPTPEGSLLEQVWDQYKLVIISSLISAILGGLFVNVWLKRVAEKSA